MTDTPDTPDTNDQPDTGERIAKVMARAGVASRREAERMIVEGRVKVNGEKITSPALDVRRSDRITIDGTEMEAPQPTRMWLYYKPIGLVTSEADEKGRQTVFDALPRDLPRVMTVGRLDLTSEGLLLLTNDGELKRRLELPATGWLRRYRVRVNGQPSDLNFDPLRRGVTIEGEEFAPMDIKIDSQQGANAWLTVGIREGKNREIRRAMAHVGLVVNRLIRIGYGPFKLTGLEPNEVREVKRKVLRDQLGGLLTGEEDEESESGFKPSRMAIAAARKPRPARRDDGDDAGRKPRAPRRDGEDRPPRRDADGERRPYARDGARDGEGADRPRKSFGQDDGARKPRWKTGSKPGARPSAEGGDRPARSFGDGPRKPREGGASGDRPARSFGDGPRAPRKFDGDSPRPPRGEGGKDGRKFDGPRKPREAGEGGPRKPGGFGGPRSGGAGKSFGPRSEGAAKGPRGPKGDGPKTGGPRTGGPKGFGPKAAGPKGAGPRGPRPGGKPPRG